MQLHVERDRDGDQRAFENTQLKAAGAVDDITVVHAFEIRDALRGGVRVGRKETQRE